MTGKRTATGEQPAAVDQDALDAQAAVALETYRHRLRLQYGEYGQWVAAVDIPAPDGGTALAFGVGHPVPVAHVERYGYEALGYVRRPDNFVDPRDEQPTPADELAEAGSDEQADHDA
jgi:hypothetical protein